jgi:integrase
VQARKPHLNFRTKTGKGRTVPLEKSLALKLEDWLRKNPKNRLVFGTAAGKEERHFDRICKRAAKNAGLDPDKFWVHKWRATFCTWALQRGVDIRKVQAWAGHSSITMTERYLSPGQGHQEQQMMNQAFASVQAGVPQ